MMDRDPLAPPRPRPPRPLEAGVVEPLVGRAQAIAKGWLLLLLERTPLEAAGAIPAAALAAEGPGLCAALVRALGSDTELDRLRSDGDLAPLAARAGALAGSIEPAATVAAVDALRACVWQAALDAAPTAFAGREAIIALADRLAAVGATVTATALRSNEVFHGLPPSAPPPPASSPGWHRRPVDSPPAAPAAPPAAPAAVHVRRGPAVAMDDGELWLSTLERHIDRCRREGGGLALLRIELVDGDHVVESAAEDERGVPYGQLAQAIRRAIRRQDLVASDHDGRAWVIAPGVGRAGAVALAERIAVGVETAEAWHGAPLAATIGFAVLGEDGHDAGALIERSEEAMLAASAAGVRIGEPIPGGLDGDDGGSEPDRPGPRLVS